MKNERFKMQEKSKYERKKRNLIFEKVKKKMRKKRGKQKQNK